MSEPVDPLSYATPSHEAPPRTWLHFVSWRTLLAGYVLVMPLVVVCLLIVPYFEVIFLDFNTKLPWLTLVVLHLSRWVRTDYGWLYLLLLPILVAIVGGTIGLAIQGQPATRRSTERRLLGWGWAALLTGFLLMAMAAILIIAMFLPMVSLVQTVSGP
jgi:hypothetical protein